MKTATLALAFAGIAAFSAVVACASAPPEDVATSTHFDTTNNSSSGDADAAPPPVASCIGTTVPAAPAWNPPAAAQSVCTPADITTLKNAMNTAQTWNDLKTPLAAQNAACSACVFTDPSAAAWGPLLVDSNGNGEVNWGACFTEAQGGSNGCGQAVFDQNDCINEMCATCSDDSSFNACAQTANSSKTACGQYNLDAACGGNFAAVNTLCPDLFTAITVSCGGGGN